MEVCLSSAVVEMSFQSNLRGIYIRSTSPQRCTGQVCAQFSTPGLALRAKRQQFPKEWVDTHHKKALQYE